MRHLYCWHQPKQQSSSVVDSAEFLELSAKVEDLESRIEDHFTFEDVVLNEGETLKEVITNPETNKIYIVENGNDKNNDTYDEYVYRIKDGGKEGSFELIGSGSFAQFKAHVNEFNSHITGFKTHVSEFTSHYHNGASGYIGRLGDSLHITVKDANRWDGHIDDSIRHITKAERTEWDNKQDKLTIDDVPKEGSTNPISSGGIWKFFPIGTEDENCNYSFAIGHQSHVCNSYSTAIGVGGTALNKGEIVISGGTENGSVVSNVELILGTGEIQGDTKQIFNAKKDGNYWASDEPYLEVRVSDNSESPHKETCRRESVRISIRNLFDLLVANGGIYQCVGFDVVSFKYKGCTTVDEVIAVDRDYLSNDIIDGVWTQSLADLSNASVRDGCQTGLFGYCSSLISFDADLSSLIYGIRMFEECNQLTSFNADLSSLTDGFSMFDGCSALTSFSSDLSKLTYGDYMFTRCSALTSFSSDLSSLMSGYGMFGGCKLTPASIWQILTTLPQNTSNKSITIGIGVSSSTVNGKNTATQLLEFANEVGYETWAKLKQAFIDKKWSVTWQYGGTTSSITLSEDEQFRGIPVYARLIEEENPEMAEYCTEDGTKYYNILWGHDVTHPEDFEYFGSLLEACGYYGVIPKKYYEP